MSATGSLTPTRSISAPPTLRWLIAALLAALALRLVWLAFTQYAYEDAYITFRYAQNIASGQGFVYNSGERIYGTTTPLLTLLLAAWLKIVPTDPLIGARLIGVGAGLAAIVLAWGILTRSGLADARRAWPLLLIVTSYRLLARDIGGMEQSLGVALMLAAWYATLVRRDWLAGLCAGLVLWTRIDLAVWVVALVTALWLARRDGTLASPYKVAAGALLTYLPWLVFALAYFGDMLPYTITAKWQAYSAESAVPLWDHALRVWQGLSPFVVSGVPVQVTAGLTLILAAAGAWHVRTRRAWWPVLIFWPLQVVTLVAARMTFQSRYFVPLLWMTFLLAGIGLGVSWNRSGQLRPIGRRFCRGVLIITLLAGGLIGGWQQAIIMRDVQVSVNDGALKAAGQWLHANTPPDSRVMLEPLGYAGYYAQRTMIDVVGLVSPQIVALQRARTSMLEMVAALQPDYVLVHCDDARGWLASAQNQPNDFAAHYRRATVFNPRNFDPAQPEPDSLARTACYEIYGPRQ